MKNNFSKQNKKKKMNKNFHVTTAEKKVAIKRQLKMLLYI